MDAAAATVGSDLAGPTVAQVRVLVGAPWLAAAAITAAAITAAAITAAALTAAPSRRAWLHRGRHLGRRVPREVRLHVRLALLGE